MVLARSTDPLLVASKNISKQKAQHIAKGKYFEQLAIAHFIKQGYRRIDPQRYNKKIQVDALLYKPSEGWLILEVKSLPKIEFDINERVTQKQAQRLYSYFLALSERVEEPVRAHLAVVSHNGDIQLYEDFLCDLIEI